MKKSKDIEEVKKVFSIEELVKFIKEDPEMQKPPKRRLSFKTKCIIMLIIAFILFMLYFLFIWKPFVYTLPFNENNYEIYGYTFETKNTGKVIYGANHINVGENIVKILPYTNYKDMDKKYIVMLSEYGHLYLYNINKDELYKYEEFDLNVTDIFENTMDIYSVIEVEFENLSNKILGIKNLINYSTEELKIMDKVIYRKDNYIVYTLDDNLYFCDYNKVRHFSMETEDYYATTFKTSKCFTDEYGNKISYIDVIAKEVNDELYVYGITENKSLTIFKSKLENKSYDELSDKIILKEQRFNKKLKSFDKNYNSNNSVRIIQENEDRKIEIYLDKIAFGAISNDTTIFTYTDNLEDPSNYVIVQGDYGNCKYEGQYYTLNKDIKELKVAFMISKDELGVVNFNLKDVSYTYNSIKLKKKNYIEDIFEKDGNIYIKIKEVIENNYVVFESSTEIKYYEYLLEDYINR